MSEQPNQNSGITLTDILFILFRRKWIIIGLTAMGAVLAVAYFLLAPPSYESQSQILVRYIQENKVATPGETLDAMNQVRMPEMRGDTIINSEISIITSLDLAVRVAAKVGATNILKGSKKPVSDLAAGGYIAGHLKVEPMVKGNVITVKFTHSDPQVAQDVLRTLVDIYANEVHLEVHRVSRAFTAEMQKQQDTIKVQLKLAEDQLGEVKQKMDVISIEDSKKSLALESSMVRQALMMAQAELAQYQALGADMNYTNPPDAGAGSANAMGTNRVVNKDLMADYRELVGTINVLEKSLANSRATLTETNPRVQNLRLTLEDSRKRKSQMEKDNPHLVILGMSGVAGMSSKEDMGMLDNYRVPMLLAKISTLTNQLAMISAEARKLDQSSALYNEYQGRRDRLDQLYRAYSTKSDLAMIDNGLGGDKVSNLSVIQTATPGGPTVIKTLKVSAALFAAWAGLGLFLAFFWERVVDRSLKRPAEIAGKLNLPLFLWIPRLALGKSNGAPGSRKSLPAPKPAGGSEAGEVVAPPVLAGGDPGQDMDLGNDAQELRPYFEALRDRLVMHFETNNLTHKPKLVALTSPGAGSGVSTLAAGLASALSEMGDGNVLLVDMNIQNGVIKPFHHGKPTCNLNDAFEGERRDSAMVKQNFYMVSGNLSDDTVPRVMPKRFSHLMPRMKGSDYDYIIFDMPPVHQTSITPRLASHMDITLLVLEAGKEPVDQVKQAVEYLKAGKVEVGVVLNKKRDFAPGKILPSI
jgi:polysaccharide biosynthesis transport protein